jgi:hypothetical protein
MPTQDEYTQKFMDGGGAIASSRQRMPGWFFALMGVVLAVAATGAISAFVASGAVLALTPLFVTVPLLALVTLVFSHLRATVTTTQVIVQYGVFGPKIALDRIETVSIEKYDMFKYGGFGIKLARDGTMAYSVPGGSGDCVRIEYRDERGKRHKVVVTVEDATGFAQAIDRARGGAVRVAVGAATAEAAEIEVEASPDARQREDSSRS